MNPLFFYESEYGVKPVDQMGCPWTRQDWIELRDAIDTYFSHTADDQIEIERQEFHDQYFYRRSNNKPDKPSAPQPKPGYIYLLHGTNTTWYKIGISKSPSSRSKNLSTQAPFPITLVASYRVDNMAQTEIFWHSTFADKHVHGEWFQLDQRDVDLFCTNEGISDGQK